MVYVISVKGEAIMPCTPVIARLLLKGKSAKCVKKTPFTIKLLQETSNYKQELTLGVDTGSKMIGTAVVNNNNEIVYMSEVEIRNDITRKMTRRSNYRSNRRSRKTRYRKARWLNRGNSIRKDRFSPTMTSKIDSHLKEINFIKSISPISKMIIETGAFDPHTLNNPNVLNNKWLYSKGVNYGYANTKAYVLARDNYKCQCCKGKKKDKKLEIHHIIYKSNGGSDKQENLITLCRACHKEIHEGKIVLKGGKFKNQLKHATQMNSIHKQLLRRLPEAIETFGYITKEHRQLLGLSKEHYVDALVIASQGVETTFRIREIILKKCVSKGDYQQTKGTRSHQVIPTGKICGFRKFDKVKYLSGEYFIKGRMSIGLAILMDIKGNKQDFSHLPRGFKTPKMNNMKRISGRKSWIVQAKSIQDITLI